MSFGERLPKPEKPAADCPAAAEDGRGAAHIKVHELRDRLLEAYRYYTGKGAWNIMEADVFWELFSDYEKLGGDGFVHCKIEPAMRALPVQKIKSAQEDD